MFVWINCSYGSGILNDLKKIIVLIFKIHVKSSFFYWFVYSVIFHNNWILQAQITLR